MQASLKNKVFQMLISAKLTEVFRICKKKKKKGKIYTLKLRDSSPITQPKVDKRIYKYKIVFKHWWSICFRLSNIDKACFLLSILHILQLLCSFENRRRKNSISEKAIYKQKDPRFSCIMIETNNVIMIIMMIIISSLIKT